MGYSADCKRRGIRLQLTKVIGRDLWKKKADGKPTYYPGADTRDGYESALLLYLASRVAELPAPVQERLQRRQQIVAHLTQHGERPDERGLTSRLQTEIQKVEARQPNTIEMDFVRVKGIDDERSVGKWDERLAAPTPTKAFPNFATVAEQYLTSRNSGRDYKTVRTNRLRLKQFTDRFGLQSIATISGPLVADYHCQLSADTNKGNRTKYHYWQMFQTFTENTCATYEIPLPANLKLLGFDQNRGDDGEAISVDPADLWTVEDFQRAKELGEWWELITLLGINCAYTNTDCDKLTGDRNNPHGTGIDWDNGRIIHRRNKTRRFPNPPKVSYKLWPRTLELLTKFAKRDGLALEMPNGGRLQTKTNDMVSRAWGKLTSKPDKKLKFLRTTGSSTLEKIAAPGMQMIYLCDKSGLASTFYTYFDGLPKPQLDEATDNLGRHFGLI